MNVFSERKVRAEQKAATRARILDAARSQLERFGYDGTNIRGVAKAARVSTGSVLQHFADKQDLLHAALFDDLERSWSEVRAKRHRALKPALTAIAKTFFDYYARRPKISRALLRESLFADPPWNERFSAQVADVHRHVATLFAAAQARGEVSSSADPALFAAAFFSFYYFALLAWLQGGLPDPLRLFQSLLKSHLENLS